MTDQTSSVLMSVYHRVTEPELAACLDSLAAQTRQPDEYVLVEDGPLPESLQTRLQAFANQHPVKIVRLPVNLGLARALNQGLEACSSHWIVRMDADDLALPNRLETQLNFLDRQPGIDVLGSSMLEFETNPDNPERLKPVKVDHGAIRAQLPWRNPVNHPTVCFRRDLVQAAGGYPDLPLLEDYYLWAKLMQRGATFHNLAEPLYLYRFDRATLARRAGLGNLRNETWLRAWMARHGVANPVSCLLAGCLQAGLRLAPEKFRYWLWTRSRTRIKKTTAGSG